MKGGSLKAPNRTFGRWVMKRIMLLVLALILLMAWSTSLPVEAASKYKACSLLTTAELGAVVRTKVTTPDDSDFTVPEGPYKGETVSVCTWVMGSMYVTLSVMRGPQTPAQRAAGLAILRDADEALKKQGWRIENVTIGGVECATYRPPAGLNALPGAGCAMEVKGFTFSLAIIGASVPVTPQQVKGLADRAAARLR